MSGQPHNSASAADSMITFSVTPGIALLTPAMSACTASQAPVRAAPTSITMSTSDAPSVTASSASRALISVRCLPDGKPATDATTGPSEGRADIATDTIDGDTHTA